MTVSMTDMSLERWFASSASTKRDGKIYSKSSRMRNFARSASTINFSTMTAAVTNARSSLTFMLKIAVTSASRISRSIEKGCARSAMKKNTNSILEMGISLNVPKILKKGLLRTSLN